MRLFIGVFIDDDTIVELQALQKQLEAQSYKGTFTRPRNLHLTLAFLGETPEGRLADLHRIIEEIDSLAFELCFNRTGCFTHSKKELWWVGADREDPHLPLLKSLHHRLLTRFEEEGFPVDKRPFNAHITLAREVRHTQPIELDCKEIRVKVDRLSLIKSERVNGVLSYTEIYGKIFPAGVAEWQTQ
ncbi:MAG: RNA 2',3'-cyclic phosphodiesterase [Treponema sp.]|nr:RNA 2',3'-cyclic phosphodiesterase [Treponema sp.]